jgi:hypothetical protein
MTLSRAKNLLPLYLNTPVQQREHFLVAPNPCGLFLVRHDVLAFLAAVTAIGAVVEVDKGMVWLRADQTHWLLAGGAPWRSRRVGRL